MSATIDFTNVNSFTGGTGTSNNLSVTCAASDNYLLSMIGLSQSGAGAPSVVQYNSVSMAPNITNFGFSSAFVANDSAWGLATPTTGTNTLNVQWTSSATVFCNCAIPLSGVNLSLAPTSTTNHAVTSTTASVSVTGAGPNDIQIGMILCQPGASLTSTGTGQTHVISPVLGINAGIAFGVDYILGGNAGNFTWTLATTGMWVTLGVTIYGSSPPALMGQICL